MSRPTCSNCAAWRPWGTQRVFREGGAIADEPIGQCRAHPPMIDPETISGTNAAWPTVAADDWCRAFAVGTPDNAASPLKGVGRQPAGEG